jgi:hypothetical protein
MGRIARTGDVPSGARDLTGMTFGVLQVLERGPGKLRRGGGREATWRCLCSCGAERECRTNELLTGKVRTCTNRHTVGRFPPSYATAHLRVRAQRGPASDHECVECGRPAEQWSFIGDAVAPTTLRAPGGYLYSLRPSLDYAPRCRRCHHLIDELERRRSGYGSNDDDLPTISRPIPTDGLPASGTADPVPVTLF